MEMLTPSHEGTAKEVFFVHRNDWLRTLARFSAQ